MYSGKIAVPPGGGGIRIKLIKVNIRRKYRDLLYWKY
jgi:hypothetical protein